MREAVVTVRDTDGTALGFDDVLGVLDEYGCNDIEVMSCEGSRGVVRVTLESELDEGRLTQQSGISWVEEVTASNGFAYLIEFTAEADPDMIDACGGDVLQCGAFDVDAPAFTLGIGGTQEGIAKTIARYEATGATVRLETLRDFEHRRRPLDSLTDRQREILQVAFDRGYFDVPRNTTTEDIAASLDVDASTVSEHLQRAERNLLSTLLPTATVQS